MELFSILKQLEPDSEQLLYGGRSHLDRLYNLKNQFVGQVGENFIQSFIDAYEKTGSPIVLNLDHNVGAYIETNVIPAIQSGTIKTEKEILEQVVAYAKRATDELFGIVRASAGHISALKMNEQSMLTFLLAVVPHFVLEAKRIYREECERLYNISVDPLIWTDEKLRDIPSTTYQVAEIIFSLGYQGIHVMPQLGPDISGALQLVAQKMGNRGVVHVINMSHPSYPYVKQNYFRGANGEETIQKLRDAALGKLEFDVDIGKKPIERVRIRATATIEPATRPEEIQQSLAAYSELLFILAVEIGPQGSLVGSALYSGAHAEGIGRFAFLRKEDLDSIENIQKKTKALKRSGLMALDARFSRQPYPLEKIMRELQDFDPKISDDAKHGVELVYDNIKTQKI